MTNLNLSKRLLALASLAKGNDLVLDVGCDHGKLAMYLILENYAKRVYASDLREKPLERAKKDILANNLSDKITCILASGIEYLEEEADLAIIAGMGGILISDIISSSKIKYVKKLLIQANSDLEIVRRTLTKLGFRIDKEEVLFEDNIYYTFILASRGESNLSDLEYCYGPIELKRTSVDFKNYLDKQVKYYLDLLNKIPSTSPKYREIEAELTKINLVLEKLK